MPIPNDMKPINRFSMREEVYNTLLDWIMEGELRPGEKILDKDVAEKMGVSRTPVREALRRLEDKGLVESAANRWTRVAEIPLEEPEMIYPIIWTLESLAMSEAFPRLTEEDFAEMDQTNEKIATALAAGDPIGASRSDAHFHNIYIARTGNYFLIGMLQDLKVRCRRIEVAYFGGSACAEDSVAEHKLILAALRAGELEQAHALISSNWKSSLGRIRNIAPRGEDEDELSPGAESPAVNH